LNRDFQLDKNESPDDRSLPTVMKRKLDHVILSYMARKIHVMLHSLDQATTTSQPFLYYLDERHKRTHRIAIYNPQELLLNNGLLFVGFVSMRRKSLSPFVLDELRILDKRLVAELVNTPGLLSYSSLELHDGNWCNLVLFGNANAKIHVTNNDTHRYAAYEFSPRCYEWIRLHNGIMPAGLAGNEMLLQRTKYYTFQEAHQRPILREVSYQQDS
jgi:hypothetical protein